jgi:LacI family transcriptional regulator
MVVTSHDVARLAGVSQPTVSRALRGDQRVSQQTRDRVADAASALGYVPSELGRSLSTRSSRQIAMVSDIDNPLYPALVAPLHDELAGAGYRMVLLAERGDEKDSYERLFDGSIDGAILTTPLLASSLAAELHRRGIPFVQLNRSSDVVDADFVIADNHAGGAAVARLLTDLGHRRLGAILGPEQTSSARGREAGFRAVLAEVPSVSVELVRPGTFTYGAGWIGLTELLRRDNVPTAIFCANDMIAIGALNAAVARNLTVPADLTVIGFDDIEMASWPCFNLSTVNVAMPMMARRAAQVLIARLNGGRDVPVQETFPTEIVLRGTHAAPR